MEKMVMIKGELQYMTSKEVEIKISEKAYEELLGIQDFTGQHIHHDDLPKEVEDKLANEILNCEDIHYFSFIERLPDPPEPRMFPAWTEKDFLASEMGKEYTEFKKKAEEAEAEYAALKAKVRALAEELDKGE